MKNTSESSPTNVSPEATGGAGTLDEYRLAAVVLAKLIRGDSVPGLGGPPIKVGLQRGVAGHVLDDIVVEAEEPSLPSRIDYQVKRRMSPTKSDAAFMEALGQCVEALQTHQAEIDSGALMLGLASAGPRGPLSELKKLTEKARSQDDTGWIVDGQATGITNRRVRERFDRVREAVTVVLLARGQSVVGHVLDQYVHRLLRVVHVWEFNISPEGRDVLDTIDRLRDLASESSDPRDIYRTLCAIAEDWGINAGLIGRSMIVRELERRHQYLTADPQHRAGLESLVAATERLLRGAPASIAGSLHLPRSEHLERLQQAVSDGSIVLVSGAPGVGKSVLARQAAVDLTTPGGLLVAVDLAGRTGMTLADVQAEYGADFARVLPTASTVGARILLIDGAEQALSDQGQLLRAIIRTVPLDGAQAPPWKLVVTTRSSVADDIASLLRGGSDVGTYMLPELDDVEVGLVIETFPQLQPIASQPRPRRLLRRPYVIDLLIRAGYHPGDLAQPIGEEDVLEIVWDGIVRRQNGLAPGRGQPDSRENMCIRVAEGTLTSTTSVTLDTIDGEAAAGLQSDEVLARDLGRYRFAHDVMADYACGFRLLREDSKAILSSAPQPRRLLRATRISVQHRLANSNGAEAVRVTWNQIGEEATLLATQDGVRWKEVPYEALVSMGDPAPILAALMARLLENDGEQLRNLGNVTLRYLSDGDSGSPNVESFQPAEVAAVAPVVAFLGEIGESVPQQLTLLAPRLVAKWSRAARRCRLDPYDYLEDPQRLSRSVAGWAGLDAYGDRLEAVLASLGLLAGHLSGESRALFGRLIKRADELDAVVEDVEVAAALAEREPDLLLRLAGRYYLNQTLTLDPSQTPPRDGPAPRNRHGRRLGFGNVEDDADGVRDHAVKFRPYGGQGFAAPTYGAFAVLLNASPRHGLRLIGEVVDFATRARIAVEASFERSERPIEFSVQRPGWPTSRSYYGAADVWMWYRRGGTGSYSAMSALLALREWCVDQLQERALDDVVDQVLLTGSSLAFVAVATSLLYRDLVAARNGLDQLLAEPLFWDLESTRVTHEQIGMAYPVSDKDNLVQPPDDVAMRLVLLGDEDRRTALRAVGERLIERTQQQISAAGGGEGIGQDDPEMLVARRRAACLDVANYRMQKSSDDPTRVLISVELPGDLIRRLQDHAELASLRVELNTLTGRVVRRRGGESNEDPVALWTRVWEVVNRLKELGETDRRTLGFTDAIGGAAACIIAASSDGLNVPSDMLASAVNFLLDVVQHGYTTMSSDLDLFVSRGTVWDWGADRSAAIALPRLLIHPETLSRSGASQESVRAALTRLACAVPSEVRQRITEFCRETFERSFADSEIEDLHNVAWSATEELLRSSGLPPRDAEPSSGHIYLAESLSEVFSSVELRVDLDSAADALPCLIAAARLTCQHGTKAMDLLRQIVTYDQVAWPKYYARQHYHAEPWRTCVDRWVASLILDGNEDLLPQYLDAFEGVGEELRGILTSLAELAIDTSYADRLFAKWPTILDRLAPFVRNLREDDHWRGPYSRDVDELDCYLLPKRPEGAAWPPSPFGAVVRRWSAEMAGRPHVVSYLIDCLLSYGWLTDPIGTKLVLSALGEDAAAINREARLTPSWLRFVLVLHPGAQGDRRSQLLHLVDLLATAGNDEALQLRRELEA